MASSLRASDERAISLYNIHTKENITLVYKRGSSFVPEALERLNWFLRDWRQNESTKIDPKLFDLLWAIHADVGSQRPIHVISGYRSPQTNAMLRETRGGQAQVSRHMLGQAIDVHFPDVPVRQLRYSAMVREAGGVGYYPNSALPFVHVDTGNVRHWPRMQRQELALLFPSARTKHVPADRKPLTAGDAIQARQSNPELALQVAAFHSLRNGGARGWAASTQIASAPPPATPMRPTGPQVPSPTLAQASLNPPARPRASPAAIEPAPRLVSQPTLVSEAEARDTARAMLQRLAVLNSDAGFARDRNQLAQMASLAAAETRRAPSSSSAPAPSPAARPVTEGNPTNRVAGPEPATERGAEIARLLLEEASRGDAMEQAASSASGRPAAPTDDDGDESELLHYDPFPVLPFLTHTPSHDDEALLDLKHPETMATIAMIDDAGHQPLVRLVAGHAARPLDRTAVRFTGRAVVLSSRLLAPPEGRRQLAGRGLSEGDARRGPEPSGRTTAQATP
ncbi:MAG: DUF882 domain-containing protein [Hyphomicrobiaceae bacterium]